MGSHPCGPLWGTHQADGTWSLYNTQGSHPCAWPVRSAWPLSLATKRCRMPKNTYSRSRGALSPKVSLKNEFSLGTHQAGRVPTWSLYNTHGVAPLCLAPFLGYTGVIPLLIHSQNTSPPPDSCTQSLPKKRVFPGYPPTLQGTHMVPLRIGVFWASGSASLPETGAKHRGATPWVL